MEGVVEESGREPAAAVTNPSSAAGTRGSSFNPGGREGRNLGGRVDTECLHVPVTQPVLEQQTKIRPEFGVACGVKKLIADRNLESDWHINTRETSPACGARPAASFP